MKKLLLVVVAISLSGTIARAEDAAKAYLKRLAGDWHFKCVEGKLKTFGVVSARLSNDKNVVHATETGMPLDQSWAYKGQAVIRQVGDSNITKGTWKGAGGTQFEDEITFAKEGSKITGKGKRTGFLKNGTPISGDITIISPDEDHISIRLTNAMTGTRQDPDMILQDIRVKFDDMTK